MLNTVLFNGGRGAKQILSEMIKNQNLCVTSIINTCDDGKSTGEIRKFFKMVGPSDVRKVQQSMMLGNNPVYQEINDLFDFRYGRDADRDVCLGELQRFSTNNSDRIGTCTLKDKKIAKWLRMFASSFLKALEVLEKGNGKRFNFSDCSVMNCLYAGAFQLFGRDFEATTMFFNRFLKLKGVVLPANIDDKKLVAIRENGDVLYSEAEIVELRSNVRIQRIFIVDEYPKREYLDGMTITERQDYLSSVESYVRASTSVIGAIKSADIIIYAPGTQHSSLYPSYMMRGVSEAIAGNKCALKIFICNVGEDYETPRYRASEFIRGAYKYLTYGSSEKFKIMDFIDCTLVNVSCSPYGENYIKPDVDMLDRLGIKIVYDEFEDETNRGKHDGKKTLDTITKLYEEASICDCSRLK